MSLVINTTTPEGIVLAADSRQSYRNLKGMARVGSDTASKLFMINKRVGIGIAGLSFLPDQGIPRNISQIVDDFRKDPDVEDLDVKEVGERLHWLLDSKYNWEEQLNQLEQSVKSDLDSKGFNILSMERDQHLLKFSFQNQQGIVENGVAGVDNIEILAAGYNQDGSHQVFSGQIPGKMEKKRDSDDLNNEYGSTWIGQGDVVSRIVLGFDGRIVNVPFVNSSLQVQGEESIFQQLQGLQYAIQWATMTLQDAVRFSGLMIKTTSAIQSFSDGINADPGDMPGVGGPVDVAIITPQHGFIWLKKKKIRYEESEVDLDSINETII